MTEVLDFMFRQDPATLAAFKASGASGVARYLDPWNPKGITPDEVSDIHAAGLSLYLFFETTGGSTRPDLYFTRAQGVADCLNAVMELAKIGAPQGTVVYFAVDVNVEPSSVTEYANGIESVATPAITPGLYGYQRLCEYAYANFPNMGKHLWQTYGTPTVPLDGWQHLQEDRAGVSVDVNEMYVPGWSTEVQMTREEVVALLAEYGLTDKYKFPALQREAEALYHHRHEDPANASITTQPLIVPFDGAIFEGSSAPLPDGTVKVAAWMSLNGSGWVFYDEAGNKLGV